jgi:hypothetical protein
MQLSEESYPGFRATSSYGFIVLIFPTPNLLHHQRNSYAMDVDEDDDFYAPSEAGTPDKQTQEQTTPATQANKVEDAAADVKEGEEEEAGDSEGSDSV